MNRLAVVLILVLTAFQTVYAQRDRSGSRISFKPFTEFKVGGVNPKDTDFGNFIGVSMGRGIDDRLYWGIEVNYFKTTYINQTTIAQFDSGGIHFTQEQVSLEFNTRILSSYLQLYYESLLSRQAPFYFRAVAGLGYNLIWNDENNFEEDIERTRFFNGLAWQLAAGVGLRISQRGLLFVDAIYTNSSARRGRDRNENGLPIFQEINVTGFGFRFGLNVVGLGF